MLDVETSVFYLSSLKNSVVYAVEASDFYGDPVTTVLISNPTEAVHRVSQKRRCETTAARQVTFGG